MSGAGIASTLTGLYAALALLLLSLHLKSMWPWPIKASAIALALPASIGTFVAVEAEIGWPSAAGLPERFQLHAVLVEEPQAKAVGIETDNDGAIFLWLTPWKDTPSADPIDEGLAVDNVVRPRAFALPYSRELHRKVETMRERLARGEMVTGNHRAEPGWQRRFGEQNGEIELIAPPPPPLPSKER